MRRRTPGSIRRMAVVLLLQFGCVSVAVAQTPPPRVGLALSGGAARGFAHVGVIEVLEERGFQIDLVTGTSMGAVIGGLYAIGYTPEMLRYVSSEIDWERVFDDQPERRNLPIERKSEDGRLLVSLPLEGIVPTLPSSIIEGQRISQLLIRLTWPAHGVEDFEALPRPFGAVATDLETGDAIPLRAGYLPQAIRASLAIPAVFAPVEIDGRLLIDGGVARNLPAEDARELGADQVVCSDVSLPLLPRDSLETLTEILNQTIAYRMWESTERQRELCNVLIESPVPEGMSAEFGDAEAIIELGREAARLALDSLESAGSMPFPAADSRASRLEAPDPTAMTVRIEAVDVVGLHRISEQYVLRVLEIEPGQTVTADDLDRAIARLYDTGQFRTVWYRLASVGTGVSRAGGASSSAGLCLEVEEDTRNRLGVAYRYDGRYKASILAAARLRNLLLPGAVLRGDVRLGEQTRFTVDYGKRWGWSAAPMAALRFDGSRMPFDLYEDGERVSSPIVRSTRVTGTAGLGLGYHTFLGIEGGYEWIDSDPAPAVPNWAQGAEQLWTIAGVLEFDRWDRRRFPRSGWTLRARVLWGDGTDAAVRFSQQVVDLEGVVPITAGLGMLGRATVGSTGGDSIPPNYLFFAGGSQQYELYRDHQFPLYGLRVQQLRGRQLQAGMLGIQWEFRPDLFAQARANAAALPRSWEWDADAFVWGWGLTLGAWTRFGSGMLTIAGEDFAHLPRLEIDVGFPF